MTDWPFVLKFLVDFVHFRPEFGGFRGSEFGVRILSSEF